MKIHKLSIPLSMTAGLVGLVACAVSCAKKNNAPEKTPESTPPPPTNSMAENTVPAAPTNTPAPVETNVVVTNVPAASVEITNPPPAETTTTAPTNEANLPGHSTVVEMSTNAPVPPANFYPATMTTNALLSPVAGGLGCTNLFLALRGGYEHIYHGDNNDSYWFSAKLYAYGDGLREDAGKNGWLIPDVDAEISTGYVPKPDRDPHPGSDTGLRFRANFMWPWFHWSTMSGDPNSIFPFSRPLTLALGPTFNLGFDHLYNGETDFRFANYAGVRLTFNRSGFIEYTVGRTEGLDSVRQQIVAELPFYESRDGAVRYFLRGLWNHGLSRDPDVLEGGVFVEMPLGLLITPEKWGDLVPFVQ